MESATNLLLNIVLVISQISEISSRLIHAALAKRFTASYFYGLPVTVQTDSVKIRAKDYNNILLAYKELTLVAMLLRARQLIRD